MRGDPLSPERCRADTHSVARQLILSGYRRARLREQTGFSVMELLVVLMIVGILATIGASVYLGMRDEGQVTAAELNVR